MTTTKTKAKMKNSGTTKTTKPKKHKPVDPLNGMITFEAGRSYPLNRAVSLEGRIILIVIANGIETAMELMKGGYTKFLGYVGPNGPSRNKLKDSTPLDAKSIGAKLSGHVFKTIQE